MLTNSLIQDLHISQARTEWERNALRRDMIRLAKASRLSIPARLLNTIGVMLISIGEQLRELPKNDNRRPLLSI